MIGMEETPCKKRDPKRLWFERIIKKGFEETCTEELEDTPLQRKERQGDLNLVWRRIMTRVRGSHKTRQGC